MRSLIISAVSLFLILAIWLGFMTYCENTLDVLVADLSVDVAAHVTAGEWPAAAESFSRFSESWNKDKSIYSFFLEQKPMAEADLAIARAGAYIEAEDKAGTLSELACIREQLRFLLLNEKITLENIM